jgi:hypothetical protein
MKRTVWLVAAGSALAMLACATSDPAFSAKSRVSAVRKASDSKQCKQFAEEKEREDFIKRQQVASALSGGLMERMMAASGDDPSLLKRASYLECMKKRGHVRTN